MELDLPPRERTIEFGKCVRCRSPSGKCRHFFVMDIMATTTCWMLVMMREPAVISANTWELQPKTGRCWCKYPG